jgi:hypothetical protein
VSAPEHSKWLTRKPTPEGRVRLPWARPAYVRGVRTRHRTMVQVGAVEVRDMAAALPRIRFECEEPLRRSSREGGRKSEGVRFAYVRSSPGH